MSVIADCDDDCSSSSDGGVTHYWYGRLPLFQFTGRGGSHSGVAAGVDCRTISAGLQRRLSTCARSSLVTLHDAAAPPSPSSSACPPHLDCSACHPQQSSPPCLAALMLACCRRLHCTKSSSSITQAAPQTQQRGICHGQGAVYYVRIHTPHGKANATQRVQRLNAAASRDS